MPGLEGRAFYPLFPTSFAKYFQMLSNIHSARMYAGKVRPYAIYFLCTSSKVFTITAEGSLVARLTMMSAARAIRKAGSSS